jgi:glutamine amidotransferase
MQLLGKGSQEGVEAGLGLLDFSAVHFSNLDGWTNRHIPNLGWNQVDVVKPDPLLAGLEAGARFYFAHSYAVPADQSAHVAATVTYGTLYAACIRRGSVFGAQFHPEKSHRFGLKLFANFIGNQSAERG